jgi:hypothetical protein
VRLFSTRGAQLAKLGATPPRGAPLRLDDGTKGVA